MKKKVNNVNSDELALKRYKTRPVSFQIISKYYAIRRIDGDALKTALAEMHDMFPMYEEELGDKRFYGGTNTFKNMHVMDQTSLTYHRPS